MTRARGRRVAQGHGRGPDRSPERGPEVRSSGSGSRRDPRLALAALVVLLLGVGSLFVAGAAQPGPGTAPEAGSRLDVGARSFSCTGGLPGTRGVAGTATGHGSVTVDGRLLARPTFPVPGPTRVVADRGAAPGAFAVQSSRDPHWLAAAPCPEPRALWWFVGAGAGGRHATVLTVTNPRPGSAVFDVDVVGPDGSVDAPGLHGLVLASGASRTIDLARMAPASGELAVRVRATRGLVSAAAAERWAPALIGRQTRDWVASQPAPAQRLDLVGLPPADGATLLVANPGTREAVVGLQVVSSRGTFRPTSHASVTVPPDTVAQVDLSQVLDARSAAVRLTANVPVAATVRSVRGSDEAYATAAQPLSGSSVVGVPGGIRDQLVLAAVGPAQQGRQTVSVTATGQGGRRLSTRRVELAGAAATRITLPRRTTAVTVEPGGADVVGAVVGTAGRGIAALPVEPAVTVQRRPGVLPGW